MKKLFTGFLSLIFFQAAFGQNLIQNGGFEQGTLPTAVGQPNFATGWDNGCTTWDGTPGSSDLCDRAKPAGTFLAVPNMGCDANPITNTALNPNNRFIHLIPAGDGNTLTQNYGESIKGTITEALNIDYEYTVSCYEVSMYFPNNALVSHQFQFVLRNNNNCTVEKIVYTSPSITPDEQKYDSYISPSKWRLLSGTFTLTQAEINQGFNKLEIRVLGGGNAGNPVYIDDVSMTKKLRSYASFVFTNLGQTVTNMASIGGSTTPVTQICQTLPKTCVTIDGSASVNEDRYYISITPWNLMTWAPEVGTTPLFNNWVCIGCQAGPKNLCDLTDLGGFTFQPGVVYKVSLNVGPDWDGDAAHTDKFIRINALPTINAGLDQTICTGSSSSVAFNVSTNGNLPINVSTVWSPRGTNYYSTQINLPIPSVTTTYTFKTTNSFGCSQSDNATVYVNITPTTTISGRNSFCQNDALSFTGALTAGTNLKYLWQIQQCDINGQNLSGPEYTTQWINGNPGAFTYTGGLGGTTNIPAGGLACNNYYRVKLVTLSPEGCWGFTYLVIRINCCTSIDVVSPDHTNSNGSTTKSMKIEEENNVISSISVSPNPTNGKFNIQFGDVAAEKIIVYNMQGKVVYESPISNEERSIDVDLTDLSSGIYMVHINVDGQIITKKLMKN